jgi:putative tryptophan/tyrosine transport system substrate-binding protein
MKRRNLMTVLAGAVAYPLLAGAQQKPMPVIGFLNVYSPPTNPTEIGRGAVNQGLYQAGFVEGQNMLIERRWAESHYDRLPALAADLVARKVNVIVTLDGTPPVLAAKNATSTIPIVFVSVGDPVGIGLVASLARPGGNATGFSNIANELMPKLVELLTELVPQAKVVALLDNPNNPNTEGVIKNTQEAARTKGIQVPVLKAGTEGEIDTAFASLGELQAGGLVVGPDGFLNSGNRRTQIVALAARYAVPVVYAHPQFTAAGGLISYGIDDFAVFRQAGIYAGRILKGEKPADLPVQQPTTFKLVVNLKTAKELGLTIPVPILPAPTRSSSNPPPSE